ncbi:MAG TPA: hydroxymethylbilane synthase [Tepidisphaeraceae bacterium]|jgi:hydroxymethylbilane synthase|nr:hydroxymethylbilane synthase [Tepidisphaeraceae bacterium]
MNLSEQSGEKVLRLGTRGSLLAKMQSQQMANALEHACPGLRVELVVCVSTGDRIQDRPLHEIGGKGLFTKELEEALLRREVDFAVHSLKDVPVTMPLVDTSELIIAAVPAREDPRDVLVAGQVRSIAELKKNALVGTGSLRRTSQLLSLRPDLKMEMIRGNVDTRLRKQREGQYDAIVLAMAGVRRAGLYDEAAMTPIEIEQMLPAAGQGALALECRRDAATVREVLAKLEDHAARVCVELERGVVLALNGDCHSPIAALARVEGNEVHLAARVGGRGGTGCVIRAASKGPVDHAKDVLREVEMMLKEQGAERLLAGS